MVTYNRPQPQERLGHEHSVIKMEKVTDLGVQALSDRAWLPQIFQMFPGERFKGALNDTLTFPTQRFTVAREYEWRTRLNPVQLDRIGTTYATIRLDKHITQAVAVTNEQATMDLASFSREVSAPQLRAIRREIDAKVMAGLRAAPLKETNLNATTGDDPLKIALQGYLKLERAGVPKDGRFWMVGADAEEWLLGSDVLLEPARGGNALATDNILGRIRGFNVISGSSLIGDDEMYFGHRSGLIVANVAPEAPFDVPNSARASAGGFSIMGTLMYDPAYQSTTSTLSTFMGVNSVNDELKLDENGLPEFDENGDPVLTGKNVRICKGTFTA